MRKINNRGQTIFLSVIVGVFIFLFGVLFLSFLKSETDNGMGTSISITSSIIPGLDCDNPSISDGAKLTCLGGELVIPYFIIILLSVAGASITERFTTSGR
jgi:hypothetical protein